MAIKSKDIQRMSSKEREEKLKELRMELITQNVRSQNNTSNKRRVIRRTIARILTFDRLSQSGETQ